MARVNVYLPDELHARAKRAKLNVSELCQAAIAGELEHRARERALDRYIDHLNERMGPATPAEIAGAKAWVERVLGAERAARGRAEAHGGRPRRRKSA